MSRQFEITTKDGRRFSITTPGDKVRDNLPTGIVKSVARGTISGGASTLELLEDLIQVGLHPTRVKDIRPGKPGKFGIPGPVEFDLKPKKKTIIGKRAEEARKAIDALVPKTEFTESIGGKVVEKVAEFPSIFAQIHALGGGTKGLTLLGAAQGSSEGAKGAAKGAVKGAILGKILQATGSMPLLTRPAATGAAFAVPEAVAGGTREDVIASGILGAGLAIARPGIGKEAKGLPSELSRMGKKILETPDAIQSGYNNFMLAAKRTSARLAKIKRRASRDPRIPNIERAERIVSKAEKAEKAIGKQFKETEIARKEIIKERAEDIKAGLTRQQANAKARAKLDRAKIKESSENARDSINSEIDKLNNSLAVESDIAALTAQKKIGEFFRRNRESYSKEFEKVAEDIDASGKPITRTEVLEILKNAKRRSFEESEVSSGEVLERIENLIAKYEPQPTRIGGMAVGPAAARLNPELARTQAEVVSFREFRSDLKSVENLVKSFKTGGRFSQEEIPAAILKSEAGELFANRVPEFAGLQSAYSEVISFMNKSNAIIKPVKGPAYTEQAAKLFEAAAKGEVTPTQERIVNFIEKGTERFGPGIGMVSARARQVSENIKVLEKRLADIDAQEAAKLADRAATEARRISELTKREEFTQKALEKELDKIELQLLQEKAAAELKAVERVEHLRVKKDRVKVLLIKRSRIDKVYKGLAFGIGALGGAGYLASRAARGAGQATDFMND